MTGCPWAGRAGPLLVAGAGVLLACEAGSPPASGVTVRDSAGVEIVESDRAVWPAAAWTVAGDPLLDLTTSGEGEAHRFYAVTDGLRLPDGGIAVAEARSGTIKLFSKDGVHRRTLGGPGGGPGEFARLAQVGRMRGDSIFAFDPRNRRVTVLALDGSGRRLVPLSTLFPRSAALLDDSTLIVVSGAAEFVEGDPGHVRRPVHVLGVAMDGSVRDTLARGAGSEAVRIDGALVDGRPLFGKDTHVDVHEGRAHLGDADAMRFRTVGPDGRVERIARVRPYDLTLDDAAIEGEIQARLSMTDTPRARQLIARLPRPSVRPAYADLIVDREGFVWLERHDGWFRNRLDPGPRPWEVFDPDGRWLGRVELPPRMTVFQIGPDWILGSVRDELDLEHPVLYRLIRASGA